MSWLVWDFYEFRSFDLLSFRSKLVILLLDCGYWVGAATFARDPFATGPFHQRPFRQSPIRHQLFRHRTLSPEIHFRHRPLSPEIHFRHREFSPEIDKFATPPRLLAGRGVGINICLFVCYVWSIILEF